MHCASNRKRERGIALILALIALLIIAALAATMIYMATSETSLVTSQKAAARSFYSAMGGIEEARYRLVPAPRPAGRSAIPIR
jgi:type II secretory pathway component PulK